MSLRLDMGTLPEGLSVKTFGFGNTVYLGEYEISLLDFLEVARYVLANTDLEPDDPRLKFVEDVRKMVEVKGYNEGKTRLK